MKHWNSILLVFATVLLIGCSRSGDFGTFITDEAMRVGGRVKTNAVLPVVEATWDVKRDENGFTAQVYGQSFGALNNVMTNAFGAPGHVVATNAFGFRSHLWKAMDIGMAIQFHDYGSHIEIVGLRGF